MEAFEGQLWMFLYLPWLHFNCLYRVNVLKSYFISREKKYVELLRTNVKYPMLAEKKCLDRAVFLHHPGPYVF